MTLGSDWQRAIRCGLGECVEVRREGDEIQVRDSKLGNTSPILSFTREEWDAFLDGANKGEFNLS